MPQTSKMGPSEWVLLLILSIVWGGAFLFYKLLDDAGIPPFTIVLGRVAVAAAVLLPVVVLTGRKFPRSPHALLAMLLLGVLNNVIPFSLIVLGEKRIDSGLASIFNATTPMFTAVIAHVFTRDEKLTPNKIVGIALGLGGVILLMGGGVLHGFDLTSWAQLACIGAAVVYGVAIVYARRFRAMGVDPIVLSAGQLCGASLIALPLAVGLEHPWTLHALPSYAWWAWLGIALPSTALAFVLYFRILERAGATNAASVTFLVPISAVVLGTLVLGERLAPNAILAMVVIFAGLAVLDGRILRLARRSSPRGLTDDAAKEGGRGSTAA